MEDVICCPVVSVVVCIGFDFLSFEPHLLVPGKPAVNLQAQVSHNVRHISLISLGVLRGMNRFILLSKSVWNPSQSTFPSTRVGMGMMSRIKCTGLWSGERSRVTVATHRKGIRLEDIKKFRRCGRFRGEVGQQVGWLGAITSGPKVARVSHALQSKDWRFARQSPLRRNSRPRDWNGERNWSWGTCLLGGKYTATTAKSEREERSWILEHWGFCGGGRARMAEYGVADENGNVSVWSWGEMCFCD